MILHFKELFALDGKPTNFTESDLARRNKIGNLLAEWGLVSIVNEQEDSQESSMVKIKIIPYKQKSDWDLVTKYEIGNKRQVDVV